MTQKYIDQLSDAEHVLKVYFKPSRINKDFVFLTVPIFPVWFQPDRENWPLKLLKLNGKNTPTDAKTLCDKIMISKEF
jgi:hypothetical protein